MVFLRPLEKLSLDRRHGIVVSLTRLVVLREMDRDIETRRDIERERESERERERERE